ncbi:DUF998 domain-containing protein [Agromyces albus]|uniref:DUF998 domain-containing protein n=1 Tax=Agromyces albus TaxID=205332 RepID=UPI00277DD5C0|nr:DUF998 domain-containing protein [Agromyces albus]MDQ0577664.1 hypothetical protein [Agromyces albus]
MATDTTSRITSARSDDRRSAPATDPLTRALVAAGTTAGPLFVVVASVQAVTREGFDLTRHPLSLLSLGDRGWVQIANFIVAGVLMLAFAIGTRRSLGAGPGRRWAPVLFGVYAAGLILGGAFAADPALGFPAGAPAGYPTELTFHGIVHAIAPPLSFLAFVAATFVVARRLSWEGHRAAAVWTRMVGVACFVLTLPFDLWMSVRLFLGVALAFAWIAAYAFALLRRRR